MPDKEEWGNIELPGLSDEELLSKDWHRIGIMREIQATEQWKQANRLGAQKRVGPSPKRSATQSKRFQDPNIKQQHYEKAVVKCFAPIKTPVGVFDSIKSVAAYFEVNVNSIHRYVDKYGNLFVKITKEEYDLLVNDTAYQAACVSKECCLELLAEIKKRKATEGCTKRSSDPEYRKRIGPGKGKHK